VAVLVVGIGRLAGDAHGDVGHGGGNHVEPRVGCLGQHPQAAGHQAHHRLEGDQQQRGQKAGEGNALLFALRLLGGDLGGSGGHVRENDISKARQLPKRSADGSKKE
jgi:hypothetical protein